jgi:Flp pilus assembly pilin Flp
VLPFGNAIALEDLLMFSEGNMNKIIRTQSLNDDGQELTEYGLLLALISTVLILAIAALKDQVLALLSKATSVLGS